MNLPDLSSEYPLSEQQIDAYQTNGHIFLRGLASSTEVSFYREAILAAVEKLNTEKRKLEDRDTYGKAFLQIYNLWRQNEILRTFVLAKRFAHVAAKLMGVQKVRLYHDQALFKEPGGGPTPWHQDQYYWPLDTNNTITMWMPLIDLNETMGIMRFASKTQTLGYVTAEAISDKSEEFFSNFIRENNFKIEGTQEAKAGDATFHAGWTLHHAPANQSKVMREVMTIIYFPDKTKVLKPDHHNRELDHSTWLMSIPPGEYAASELNPLID
ncbi:MAG TPA: phytanoyl-CoA dioxygenase family protein [Cyclobacteriaceae bacterium]|nr:phytanoyl-CoA dioxygenase family protein [Cyclobacteriaceae bacterium]